MNTETTTEAETVFSATATVEGQNVAMGDINQYTFTGKDRLARVRFNANDADYLSPNFAGELIARLAEKRVIILSENDAIARIDLVRHIAGELTCESTYSDMPVYELSRESEENEAYSVSVSKILQDEDCTGKVILLYDLHPGMIDYRIDSLISQTRKDDCFFIITASCSLETWSKAGSMVSDYWFAIPTTRHHSEEQLYNFLVDKLRQKPPHFLEETVMEDNFLLSPSIRVSEVVLSLTSLEQIQLLLSCYCSMPAFPTDHRLNELIDIFQRGHEQMVKAWFYQLSHRDKILALTAALFDGMLVDQYLEALKTITDSSFWDIREPFLKAIDYFDLSALDAFFHLQMRGQEQFLIVKSQSSKQVLLELGKTEYRRHFKTGFSAFLDLTKKSYARNAINWELYGTSVKRVSIRQSFTEALRLTGSIEFRLVENYLLELASTGHTHLQNICAKAIAQWRSNGNEQLFFQTLKSWQEDEEIAGRMELLFERNVRKLSEEGGEAIDLIMATAVLALGHASSSDQPNQLHEEIVEAMTSLALQSRDKENLHKNIRRALPQFIQHHSIQLGEKLYADLLPAWFLREPIAEGLLKALESYPSEVSNLMKTWLDACVGGASSKANRRDEPTYRDNRLLTLIEVLLQLDFSENPIFPEELLYTNYLIPLIAQENRDAVVEQVLKLLAKVQSGNYELAQKYASQTIGKLSKARRLKLVEFWGDTYRQQRLDTSSSGTFEQNGKIYPVWTSNDGRPITSVEKTLYSWMDGSDVLRRFATLVFLEVTRNYDRPERNERMRLDEMRRQQEQWEAMQMAQPVNIVYISQQEHQLHLGVRIHIFLYFIFSSNSNKFLLKDTILLFLNVSRYSSTDLEELVQRWKRSSNQGITSKLAKWLPKFLRFR